MAALVRTCESNGDALTFSGTIESISERPGGFSGSAVAYQDVVYRIESPSDLLLARGERAALVTPPCNVTVSYEIQWTSPLVDHGTGGLDRTMFREGNRQIVGTTWGFRRWVGVDTWEAPILATNQRIQETRQLLTARGDND